MRIETVDSIVIHAPREKVYALAQKVEEYGRYAPQYKKYEVVERDERHIVIRRWAKTILPFSWTSEGTFAPPHTIRFVQTDGRLRGMETLWQFEPVEEGTQVRIVHRFEVNIPLIARWVGYGFLYRFFIRPIAQALLRNLKADLETSADATSEGPRDLKEKGGPNHGTTVT
ncbi:MAG TPA: hypothetical protein EYP85_06325 [Armatimonadetes bacterium]|nr:hypothetical protein [Armatimonadota bacterium]